MVLKKRRKPWIIVLVIVISVVVVLGSCGNSGNAQNGGDTGGNKGDSSGEATSAAATYLWGDAKWEAAVRSKVEGTTFKIGFTPPAASEFYDIIMHGAYSMMNEIHDRFGVNFEFEFVAPSEHDAVESQIATIENWATKKFDAVLICTAGDFESMNAVFDKTEQAGTSVYLYNMPTELWDESTINAVSIISYNNAEQSGRLVGEYAAEKLNGEGEILFISGNDGHWTTSRSNGFKEAIAQYPGLKIVGEQRGEYVRDKGMEAAENMLQAHPNVKFIYGENEEMAQGAVQAIQAMGKKVWDGNEGIIVVGADGLLSGYEQIEAGGGLTATVDVGSVDMGRESIRSIFLHELLGYSLDKVTNVPTILVDASNVDIPRDYVEWALSVKEEYK
jgi:ribose transport system substrate-binding protein